MRIGLVVNDVMTEGPRYTTTRLSYSAQKLGHEVWTMGVGDFINDKDGSVNGPRSSCSRVTVSVH